MYVVCDAVHVCDVCVMQCVCGSLMCSKVCEGIEEKATTNSKYTNTE